MHMLDWCVTCRQDSILRAGTTSAELQVDGKARYLSLCPGCYAGFSMNADILREAWDWLQAHPEVKTGESKEPVITTTPGPGPKIKHLCACQCGQEVPEGQRFIEGHEANAKLLPPANKPTPARYEKPRDSPKPAVTKPSSDPLATLLKAKDEAPKNFKVFDREEKAMTTKRSAPVFAPRICKLGSCAKSFMPTGAGQKFCTPQHKKIAWDAYNPKVPNVPKENKIVKKSNGAPLKQTVTAVSIGVLDLTAVLAELQRRRAALDAAIEGIKALQ